MSLFQFSLSEWKFYSLHCCFSRSWSRFLQMEFMDHYSFFFHWQGLSSRSQLSTSEFIDFWLHTVHACAAYSSIPENGSSISPAILIVGTHRSELHSNAEEQLRLVRIATVPCILHFVHCWTMANTCELNALPDWGCYLSAELIDRIDALVQRSYKYDVALSVLIVIELMDTASHTSDSVFYHTRRSLFLIKTSAVVTCQQASLMAWLTLCKDVVMRRVTDQWLQRFCHDFFSSSHL